MKRFLQYALALTTVVLLTAVVPEAYAQNRAHNTSKNNTTQTTKQSGSKPSSTSSSKDKKPQSGTTASDRNKKPTVTTGSSTKPASSTPSKPTTKPETKPSNSSSTKPSGSHNPGSSSTKPSSKPSGQPSNHQPSAKPDNKPSGSHNPSGNHNPSAKVGGNDNHKGNTPKPGTSHNPGSTKPSSHSSSHNPGHKPDHKPGKYTGHYESHPTPGHDYGHHMPDRIDRKPGVYQPKPNYHHSDHYFGHFINTLPRGYHSRRYNKIRYYYYDGIYYRRINGYYCICRPPFGIKIAMNLFGIIPAAVWFSPNARYIYDDCYCWDGVFYRLRGRYYHVIEPPIGALIPQIPSDYEIVMMNGSTCYRVEDTLYQMVVLDGRIWFEVIANLAPRYY